MSQPDPRREDEHRGERELTLRAVVLGLLLSIVMGAANVYLGLYAGMTVSASIPAAVVGMLVLRSLFRSGSVVEANQIQTAASAGESLAAGIIFTVPALVLIGAWDNFIAPDELVPTTVIALTGGLLGILFMIPMRRVFVVNNAELPFPEGVACAAVLTAGHSGQGARSDARQVLLGGVFGAVVKSLVDLIGVIQPAVQMALGTAGRVLYIGGATSPALVAVGYIVRLNVAALVFAGGALAWLVCIPLYPELRELITTAGHAMGVTTLGQSVTVRADPLDTAQRIWSEQIRYAGVGAMTVGGIVAIVRVRHGLAHAVRELWSHVRIRGSASRDEQQRDLPPSAILVLAVLAVLLVVAVYFHFTRDVGVTALTTAIMLVMSFFFVAVASYIVGLVGNSNSPVSGMTITTVLFTGAMVFVLGYTGMQGMLATLGVAAVVCCAACTSGDVCNDLKTGSLVGASPRRQQMMQIGGVLVASMVMAPVLYLLNEAYVIGSDRLVAPQANLFASLARGFFGAGNLPWGMVGFGALIGLAVHGLDLGLEARSAPFRAHLMPVAVGMYLPLKLSTPIVVGGVLAHFIGRGARNADERNARLHPGVLLSSGVIAGESLMGVLIALLAVLQVGVLRPALPLQQQITLIVAVGLVVLFARLARPRGG